MPLLVAIAIMILGVHASASPTCDIPIVDMGHAGAQNMTLRYFLDTLVGVRDDYARPVLLRNLPDRWLADPQAPCRHRNKFLHSYGHLPLPLRGDAGLISRTGAPPVVGTATVRRYVNATDPPIVFDASAASDVVPYLVSTGAFAIPAAAGGVLRRTFYEPARRALDKT